MKVRACYPQKKTVYALLSVIVLYGFTVQDAADGDSKSCETYQSKPQQAKAKTTLPQNQGLIHSACCLQDSKARCCHYSKRKEQAEMSQLLAQI